jgi:hypothetical protein
MQSIYNFLDSMVYPIALKGIPISSILSILSIILIGFFSLSGYNGGDEIYIRNVHIILLISVVLATLISGLYGSYFTGLFAAFTVLSNIFVLTNTGYSNDGIDKDSVLFGADVCSLFLLIFVLVITKDRYFYSECLRNSNVPKNAEKIFALTRSLIYGRDNLSDIEKTDLIKNIGRLYKEQGYTVLANRAEKLAITYYQYNNLFKSLTERQFGGSYSRNFESAVELIDCAKYAQENNENL